MVSLFQSIFDRYLGWLRDTGVIQKMLEDSVRAARAPQVDKIVRDRPLSVMR